MERQINPTGVLCPSCGHVNIQGEDRCAHCLYTLMQRDLPRPRKDDPFQNIVMTTSVSELLTGRDLLVARPDDSVQKIVEVFNDKKKSCVLIYDKKRLCGILSKRDILLRTPAHEADLSKIKAEEIMTPSPEFVRSDAPIAYVVNVMAAGGFRHVPVLAADGTPLSIISIQDVMSFLIEQNSSN